MGIHFWLFFERLALLPTALYTRQIVILWAIRRRRVRVSERSRSLDERTFQGRLGVIHDTRSVQRQHCRLRGDIKQRVFSPRGRKSGAASTLIEIGTLCALRPDHATCRSSLIMRLVAHGLNLLKLPPRFTGSSSCRAAGQDHAGRAWRPEGPVMLPVCLFALDPIGRLGLPIGAGHA